MLLPMTTVPLIRNGQERPVKVFCSSGDEVVGAYDLDVEEGDILKLDVFGDRVVSEVHHRKQVDDTLCVLVSITDWRTQRGASVNQTWNIGSAGAIAGRDIHEANVAMMQFLQKLEESIKADSTIPEERKPGILARLGDFVLNPKVIEAAATAVKAICS
jgi:hypothetical protein